MEKKVKETDGFEKKHLFYGLKHINNSGKFCGYASVFNIEDSCKDTIIPGAFKNTLKRKNIKSDIKLLWQHIANKPIGFLEIVKEDAIGLYIEGQIMLDIQQGFKLTI